MKGALWGLWEHCVWEIMMQWHSSSTKYPRDSIFDPRGMRSPGGLAFLGSYGGPFSLSNAAEQIMPQFSALKQDISDLSFWGSSIRAWLR